MFEGNLNFVDELGAQKFLFLTDLLSLHRCKSRNTTECLSVNLRLMVERSFSISDYSLCIFQITKSLIQFFLELEECFFHLFPL